MRSCASLSGAAHMSVPIACARICGYLERFSIAWENFGFVSAVRVFAHCRWKSVPGGVSLPVKKLRKTLWFRGKIDKGVLSHFYKPGIRIRDTPSNPVRVIVDAGANIGDETLRFRHFHPSATIVAIEPDSGNCSMLSRNVLSDLDTKVLKGGLWSHECRLRVVAGGSAEAFRVIEADGDAQADDVEAISIASIMKRFSFDEIDILKMDIEGAEYEVFSSPSVDTWIHLVRVLIFECPDSDRPGATQKIFEKLARGNFTCHIHGECFVLIRKDTGWSLESNNFL